MVGVKGCELHLAWHGVLTPAGVKPKAAKGGLQLLSLHPRLTLELRAPDISAMTKDDKLTLLGEINDVLGIKRLKSE
jgi:hypothetical protein